MKNFRVQYKTAEGEAHQMVVAYSKREAMDLFLIEHPEIEAGAITAAVYVPQ